MAPTLLPSQHPLALLHALTSTSLSKRCSGFTGCIVDPVTNAGGSATSSITNGIESEAWKWFKSSFLYLPCILLFCYICIFVGVKLVFRIPWLAWRKHRMRKHERKVENARAAGIPDHQVGFDTFGCGWWDPPLWFRETDCRGRKPHSKGDFALRWLSRAGYYLLGQWMFALCQCCPLKGLRDDKFRQNFCKTCDRKKVSYQQPAPGYPPSAFNSDGYAKQGGDWDPNAQQYYLQQPQPVHYNNQFPGYGNQGYGNQGYDGYGTDWNNAYHNPQPPPPYEYHQLDRQVRGGT